MTHHFSSHFPTWLSMVIAIFFELVGTINAPASQGLTTLKPTCIMLAGWCLSVVFLSFALDKNAGDGRATLDLGSAYATWTGLGIVVSAIAGAAIYGEKLIPMQYVGMVVTMFGVAIINLAPTFFGDSNDGSHVGLISEDEKAAVVASTYGSV